MKIRLGTRRFSLSKFSCNFIEMRLKINSIIISENLNIKKLEIDKIKEPY
jgi:hypothetical protein